MSKLFLTKKQHEDIQMLLSGNYEFKDVIEVLNEDELNPKISKFICGLSLSDFYKILSGDYEIDPIEPGAVFQEKRSNIPIIVEVVEEDEIIFRYFPDSRRIKYSKQLFLEKFVLTEDPFVLACIRLGRNAISFTYGDILIDKQGVPYVIKDINDLMESASILEHDEIKYFYPIENRIELK